MKRDEPDLLSVPAGPADCSKRSRIDLLNDGKVHDLDRWLLERLLAASGNPPLALVLWDGQEVSGRTPVVARLLIHNRSALLKLIVNPDLYFGELYTSRHLQVEGELLEVLLTINRSLPDFNHRNLWIRLLAKLYLVRRNTLPRAQENIHHHYDIGNDFYRLWLDEHMVYTCAYFPKQDLSLEQAQVAKLDHVCRKLRLKPGESVVEAGCGWGALALHMGKYYGVKVKAYNISREQVAFARERARREGLQDQVEFIQEDYREIDGKYDAFVSVGMLEHVGLVHYQELSEVINRCLKPSARGLIHSIGRNRPAPMNPWIQRHIFPGAYPPSLGEMTTIFEPQRFSILDVENLRLHYAKTLEHWLQRYEASLQQVTEMFDDAFVRAWRFYLAGSIAAFLSGELQLFQVLFTRFNDNQIPWSREFLYKQS